MINLRAWDQALKTSQRAHVLSIEFQSVRLSNWLRGSEPFDGRDLSKQGSESQWIESNPVTTWFVDRSRLRGVKGWDLDALGRWRLNLRKKWGLGWLEKKLLWKIALGFLPSYFRSWWKCPSGKRISSSFIHRGRALPQIPLNSMG